MPTLFVIISLMLGVLGARLSAQAEPPKRATADILDCQSQRSLGNLQLTERSSTHGGFPATK